MIKWAPALNEHRRLIAANSDNRVGSTYGRNIELPSIMYGIQRNKLLAIFRTPLSGMQRSRLHGAPAVRWNKG